MTVNKTQLVSDAPIESTVPAGRSSRSRRFWSYMRKYWVLYVFLIPAMLDVLIFSYGPMYGVVIAFQDYRAKLGISGSEWVGLKHFIKFVESPNFIQILTNTLGLAIKTLVFSFPIPIILAVMLNEVRNNKLKKASQMITYLPHFISVTAVIGLIRMFVDPNSGLLNFLITSLGGEAKDFLGLESAYQPIYIISEIWQHTGWNTIIYLSALTTVDQESLESARLDGCNRLQKIWYIDIPTIPSYLLIKSLGLIDNPLVMILPGAFSVYNMIITRTYFAGFPESLCEAAKIDGAGEFRIFMKIVLPLSGSIVAVMALYHAVAHWNSYYNALLYLNDKNLFPLQLVMREVLMFNSGIKPQFGGASTEAIQDLVRRKRLAETMKYSLIVLANIPILIAYPFVQKYFVKGVMIGSVKG